MVTRKDRKIGRRHLSAVYEYVYEYVYKFVICAMCIVFAVLTTSEFSLLTANEPGFIISAGTFTLSNFCIFDVSGSIRIESGANATIEVSTAEIRLTRSWVNFRGPAGFVFGSSTVTLYDVLSSTFTGSTTFYALRTLAGSKSIFFAGGSTQTIRFNFIVDGGAEGTRIVLRSTTPAVRWCLNLVSGSTHTVRFVDVRDSNATGLTVYALNSADSGNNINWVFIGVNEPPYPPKDLAQYSPTWAPIPVGRWINYQQIRTTFTLVDPNAEDTLQFNIQFSSHPNFAYIFINATSPPTATLLNNTATNYINTVLFPEGTWYWRVNCTDNGGLSSAYSSMTVVEGRHFGVDLTTPTIPEHTSPLNNSLTNQFHLTFTGNASQDTLSGISQYTLNASTAINFTGVIFSSVTANTFATLTLYQATWYWCLRAEDRAGNYTAWTTPWSVIIDTTPPPAITNLTALKVTTVLTTPVDLTWTNVTDPSGISHYKIYRSTDNVTFVHIANDPDGSPYRDTTTLFNTLYYYRIAAVDNAGNEATLSNVATVRTARCAIDGYWTDWSTPTVIAQVNISSVIASGIAHKSEFIFWDKSGEQRNDPNGPNLNSDFDLRAVHICADDTHIYFLIRYRDITASVTNYFCISIDTDRVSGVGLNIHGDDTWMTIGDKANDLYGQARANPEINIIVHSTSSVATPIIELATSPVANPWYAPPTPPGMYATYLRADMPEGVDGVEIKLARSDVGLVGDKIARIIVASYQPRFPLGWANLIDTTMDYADRAALDSIAIARLSTGSLTGQFYNDPAWSMNAWDEDISDQDFDFWFDVRIEADGTITNVPPPSITTKLIPDATNTLTPTLIWQTVSEVETNDAVTSWMIEFATHPALGTDLSQVGEYGYRVNVREGNFKIPSPLKNLTTYYWRVWQRDMSGALSETATVFTLFVDTTPPSGVTLLSPANGTSVNLPVTFDWTDAIEDSGWAVKYIIEIDSDTSFSPPEISVEVTTSVYTISTLSPGLHYWRARARDAAGNLGPWSATWSFHVLVPKVVNGDPSDWVGQPITDFYPERRYQARVGSEWIWTDRIRDHRGDGWDPDTNYGLTEVRVAGDTDWIYLLFKLESVDENRTFIAVAIDTNIVSGVGMDWLADGVNQPALYMGNDEDSWIGGTHYPETASQPTFSAYNALAETNVIFHKPNDPPPESQWWTEYYPGGTPTTRDFTRWDGVAGSSVVFSAANKTVEARICRRMLGLVGDKIARFTFAVLQSSGTDNGWPAWANSEKTNRNWSPGILDCVKIMRPVTGATPSEADRRSRNEPVWGRNVWWKEFQDDDGSDPDQAIDFWVQLRFNSAGAILNQPPNAVTVNLTPATVTGTLTPTFDWGDATDPDSGDAVTTYMIEIGKTTDLDGVVDWRVNTTSSVFTVPSPGLHPGTTYFWRVWSRDRSAVMTPSQIWTVYIDSPTAFGPMTVPPFTPIIDGYKDTRWGTVPSVNTPNLSRRPGSVSGDYGYPHGLCRAVYVTNDAAYLYIGWEAMGDPWGGENRAPAQYNFILETKRDFAGTNFDPDPGKTYTTGLNWVYKPDVWIQGRIKYPDDNFSTMREYNSELVGDNFLWGTMPVVYESGFDFKVSVQNLWGEVRIPLKRHGIRKDNIIQILYAASPGTQQGDKNYCDSTPFDSHGTQDYAEPDYRVFSSTAMYQYRIQYALVEAMHKPSTSPVVGLGMMREPLNPGSGDKVKIMVSIYPEKIYDFGFVYFTTNNYITTHRVEFGLPKFSGGYEYRWAEIPSLPLTSRVSYYIEIEANGMKTFVYGPGDLISGTTNVMTFARTNSWYYTVTNASPTAPTIVTLTPEYPSDTSDLTSEASGATDPDGQPLVYIYEWYRNGIFYSSGTVTTAPYSTTLSNTLTSPGDEWYIRWRARDTLGALGSWTTSSVRPILGRTWSGVEPNIINVSTISISEYIWRDKTNETDIKFDLRELRIFADSSHIWFLFKLGDIVSNDEPFIAVAIDTDTVLGSGSLMIGDDTNITVGEDLSPPYQARWEKQLILHSTSPGSFTAEITTSPTGIWALPSSDFFTNCFVNADVIEAKILRSDLWLVGSSSPRISIATFKNSIGRAQISDTTETDAIDSVSIIRVSTGSLTSQYTNDPTNDASASIEDLSDNDVDFWLQVPITATSIGTNSGPPAPSSPSPPHNSTTDYFTPLLSWTQSPDINVGDAVTSWLIEFNNTPSLDGTVLYRVNVSTTYWRIPEKLLGNTSYYWRVSARDRCGFITVSPTWQFYLKREPRVVAVYDNRSHNNLDNYGRITGIEDKDGTVTWTWEAVEPGTTYYIDISTTLAFTTFYIQNFSTTSLYYTAIGLTPGLYYYARVKPKTPDGTTGGYTVSDGIYINRINADGTNSDWLPIPSLVPNTTGLLNNIAYWRDAITDARKDVADWTQLDLGTFAICTDRYNIYFYLRFNTAVTSGFDGKHFIQIAVDNEKYSSRRTFIGRLISSADTHVSVSVPYEYLVKILSGLDLCDIYDPVNDTWRPARYSENISGFFFECAVPYEYLGGEDRFLGKSVNFTVVVASQIVGNVAGWGGDNTSDMVDVISSTTTWEEVNDRVVDFYFTISISTEGKIISISQPFPPGTVPPSTPEPVVAVPGSNAPSDWARWSAVYNIFVERFFSGTPDNDKIEDSQRKVGGDLQGVIQKLYYLNELGMNVLWLNPITRFDDGVWGYNVNDMFAIDPWIGNKTAPVPSLENIQPFIDLCREARNRNIKVVYDWIPGQMYGGRTYNNHKKLYFGQRFGGHGVRQFQADTQLFYADTAKFWSGVGSCGYRVDNPKFYRKPEEEGDGDFDNNSYGWRFFETFRNKVHKYFPEIWTFGEMVAGAGDIGAYTALGDKLVGCLDWSPQHEFRGRWVLGGHWKGDVFGSIWDGHFARYGDGREIMVSFMGNHDHARHFHIMNHNPWKSRMAYQYVLLQPYPPKIFYGDEVVLEGHHENEAYYYTPLDERGNYAPSWCLYQHIIPHGANEEFKDRGHGSTCPFPWGAEYSGPPGIIRDSLARTLQARMNFSQLQYFHGAKENFQYLPALVAGSDSNNIYCFRRWRDGMEAIIALNRTDDGIICTIDRNDAPNQLYKDWLTDDSFLTNSGGDIEITIPGNYARILIRGGYDWGTATGTVRDSAGNPVAGAIVSVDGKSHWTVTTNTEGYFEIGGEARKLLTGTRTFKVLCPGYNIQKRTVSIGTGFTTVNFTPASGYPLTVDTTPPAIPKGLSAKFRDRAIDLDWEPNTEEDIDVYIIYRRREGSPYWEKIMECTAYPDLKTIGTAYYDNDLDRGLINGVTYYYRLRARDISGNLSGYSEPVSAVPGVVKVKFFLDVRNYPNWETAIDKVEACGNSIAMGYWPGYGGTPTLMKSNANGSYEVELEYDLEMYIDYKYRINGIIWEQNFGGYPHENRELQILDEGGRKMLVVNRWNVDGDTCPWYVSGLNVTPEDKKILIGWDKAIEPDVVKYIIYYSIAPDASANTKLIEVSKDITSYQHTGLTNGVTYYYRISAVDRNNYEGMRTPIPVFTYPRIAPDTTPPSAPSDLKANALTFTQIKVYWKANPEPDVIGYNIYRNGVKVNSALIPHSASPYFIDSGLTISTTYFYRVSAVDTSGNESLLSAELAVHMVPVTFRVDMGNINPSTVRILGDVEPLDIEGAQLLTKLPGSTFWEIKLPFISNQSIKYKYKSDKIIEQDFNTPSRYREYTIPYLTTTKIDDWEENPERIKNLKVYPGVNKVYLYFDKNTSAEDLAGYNIYISTIPGAILTTKINPSPISYIQPYVVENLTTGTTYFFCVKAVDSGEIQLESSESNIVFAIPEEPIYVNFGVPYTMNRASDLWGDNTRIKLQIAIMSGLDTAVWNTSERANITNGKLDLDPTGANTYRKTIPLARGQKYNFIFFAETTSNPPPGLSPNQEYYDTVPNTGTFIVSSSSWAISVPAGVIGYFNPVGPQSDARRILELPSTLTPGSTLYVFANFGSSPTAPTYIDAIGKDKKITLYWSAPYGAPWVTIINNVPLGMPGESFKACDVICGGVYEIYMTSYSPGSFASYSFVDRVPGSTFTYTVTTYKGASLVNNVTYYFILRSSDTFRGAIGTIDGNHYSIFSATVSAMPTTVHVVAKFRVNKGARSPWKEVRKSIAVQEGTTISAWDAEGRSNMTPTGRAVTMTPPQDDPTELEFSAILTPDTTYNFILFAYSTFPIAGLQVNTTYFDTVPTSGSGGMHTSTSTTVLTPLKGIVWCGLVSGSGDARRFLYVPPTLPSGTTLYVYCNFGSSPVVSVVTASSGDDGKSIELSWVPYGSWGTQYEWAKAADVIAGGFYHIWRSTISPSGPWRLWYSTSSMSWVDRDRDNPGDNLGLIPGQWYYYVVVSSDAYTGRPGGIDIVNMYRPGAPEFSKEDAGAIPGMPVPTYFKCETTENKQKYFVLRKSRVYPVPK